MSTPRELPTGFAPYVWATQPDEIAARHGLDPAQVIRFDANVPPLPGVPPIPLGESFARLNEYPEGTYRELREAAAGYAGVDPGQVVVGAGADDLIGLVAQAYLAPGRTASITPPTYPLYAIASGLEGAEVVEAPLDPDALARADVVWVCNPGNPTGELLEPEFLAGLARELPDVILAVDEAYYEYGGASVVPFIEGAPNLVAIRTLSKAFGFAALRVGYALASPGVAAELTRRRAPAPIATPAARIAAAALRAPRLEVEELVEERERVRRAFLTAGFDCPPSYANFVLVRLDDPAEVADRLDAQGLVVRRVADAIRITIRLPAENDRLLAALGVQPEAAASRSALVVRTTAETAIRASLDLDGRGRARIDTGIGFLDHLLTQVAFHGGFDLELLAGGDLGVDEHHTVEDVLGVLGDALREALGDRTGLTRFGAATVPMDEAQAEAVVDLVRRPHAEIDLAFTGERVGGLATTLVSHALERFAAQAAITLHVAAGGADDHHVAEAAAKALGRALRAACARGDEGSGSTKGVA